MPGYVGFLHRGPSDTSRSTVYWPSLAGTGVLFVLAQWLTFGWAISLNRLALCRSGVFTQLLRSPLGLKPTGTDRLRAASDLTALVSDYALKRRPYPRR